MSMKGEKYMQEEDTPINKSSFNLNLLYQPRNARKDVASSEHRFAVMHEFCHAVFPIANTLLQL